MTIILERVYNSEKQAVGYRVLVDRVWPRGVSRASLALDEWCREIAPSTELRKWFGHDARRWQEFRRKYLLELQSQAGYLERLRDIAAREKLILLYGARDAQYNQAVVLRDALCAAAAVHKPRSS